MKTFVSWRAQFRKNGKLVWGWIKTHSLDEKLELMSQAPGSKFETEEHGIVRVEDIQRITGKYEFHSTYGRGVA